MCGKTWRVYRCGCCRQAGEISEDCLDALEERAHNLALPSSFVEFARPDNYPRIGKATDLALPHTIVGVPYAHETESVYHDFVRRLPNYCNLYDLTCVQSHALHGDTDGDSLIELVPVEFKPGAPNMAKRVMYKRQDHFFFRYVNGHVHA